MSKNITIGNCVQHARNTSVVNATEQAQCWQTVYEFCRQNGMKTNTPDTCSLEQVIGFLEEKIKSDVINIAQVKN